MSFYKGLSCPVCKKQFHDNEDIVVCPRCGLPHHRDCWHSIGKCFADDKHGTEHQWSRKDEQPETPTSDASHYTQICPHCHTANAEYAEFCNRCGSSLASRDWQSKPRSQYIPHNPPFYSAPSHSSEKIDGIAVEELSAYVGKNSQYYINRFRSIQNGRSGGLNWAAFLLSPFWLFYRKQYALGLIYLLVYLLANITAAIVYAPVQLANTPEAFEAAMYAVFEHPLCTTMMLITTIFMVLKVVLALRANHFYFKHCVDKITAAKETTPDLSVSEISTMGGVSVGMAVLVYVLSSILIEIITILAL